MDFRIKEVREAKKISQRSLAKKANVSRVIISRLENGTRKVVKTDTLEKIANALEVRVEELFM